MPESSCSFVDTGLRRCDVMLLIPDRLRRGSLFGKVERLEQLRNDFRLRDLIKNDKPQPFEIFIESQTGDEVQALSDDNVGNSIT